MYRIRQLPVLQNEAIRTIRGVGEYDHPLIIPITSGNDSISLPVLA